MKTGVPVLMDNPREVGTDRIVNALAAAQLFGGPAIVVDFGTATTFDVVSARGEYVGGAIAPGIDISLEALGRRGAQLRKVELLRPRSVIAKNTVEALQSGIVYGFASQVDGIVGRMTAELGLQPDQLTVIATGGLAPAGGGGVLGVRRARALADPSGPRAGVQPQRAGGMTRRFRAACVAAALTLRRSVLLRPLDETGPAGHPRQGPARSDRGLSAQWVRPAADATGTGEPRSRNAPVEPEVRGRVRRHGAGHRRLGLPAGGSPEPAHGRGRAASDRRAVGVAEACLRLARWPTRRGRGTSSTVTCRPRSPSPSGRASPPRASGSSALAGSTGRSGSRPRPGEGRGPAPGQRRRDRRRRVLRRGVSRRRTLALRALPRRRRHLGQVGRPALPRCPAPAGRRALVEQLSRVLRRVVTGSRTSSGSTDG